MKKLNLKNEMKRFYADHKTEIALGMHVAVIIMDIKDFKRLIKSGLKVLAVLRVIGTSVHILLGLADAIDVVNRLQDKIAKIGFKEKELSDDERRNLEELIRKHNVIMIEEKKVV